MDTTLLAEKFATMGARVKISPVERQQPLGRWTPAEPRPLVIDIRADRRGEHFDVRVDDRLVELDVVDLKPKERHLLLLARFLDSGQKDKFLCGHDERHWFVAAIPDMWGVSNVRTAMEALKPSEVVEAQERVGVKFRDRSRRSTKAYVRQGEWFFLPCPGLELPRDRVLRTEPLRRGNGKPHIAEQLYREGGETVYVSPMHPNGLTYEEYSQLRMQNPAACNWVWRTMQREPTVYVRGAIKHPDHSTVVLPGWHRVAVNTESKARAMRNVAFLD